MKKKAKKKLIVRTCLTIGITLVAAALVAILMISSGREVQNVPQQLVYALEAGETPDFEAFFKKEGLVGTLAENSKYDPFVPGDYNLTVLLSEGGERSLTLKVRDTVAPSYLEMPPIIVKKGIGLSPEMLLPADYIIDATAVKLSFLSSGVGSQKEGLNTVSLRLTDGGGNTTVAKVNYYVSADVDAGYFYEIGDVAPDIEKLVGSDFILKPGTSLTLSHPGYVTVYLLKDGEEYVLHYEAKDTIAPVAVVKTSIPAYFVGDALPDPMEFVESFYDMTQVTASYAENYVLDKAEQKEIVVKLTDEGGNVLSLGIFISVLDDEEGADTRPPVITGVKNLSTELGSEPDYLDGVSAYDGRDGVIDRSKIRVDTSLVDLYTPSSGEGYLVTYSVFDAAGNRATATAHVKVVESILPDEELEIFFDQLMTELNVDPSSSRMSVLSRVYELLTGSYKLQKGNANSDLSDYRKEAYWGFRLKKGNSETACAMLSVILDKLDIEYIKVYRNTLDGAKHCWMLVDYGIGWLYMDCLPTYGYIWTIDGRFLRTDSAEAKQLSEADEKRREAMTAKDIAELTALSNEAVVGWDYYRADTSVLPETAEKLPNGQYRSPKYTVTYKVNQSIYGSIYGLMNQTISHGNRAGTVTAVAKPGYKFVRWSDGNTSDTRSDVIIRNTELTAEFEPDGQTVEQYTVIYIASEGGKIEGTDVQERILYGKTTEPVKAVAEDGYYFVGWSDGVPTAERFDTVRGDVTYEALFAPKKVLSYLAAEGGSITGVSIQKLLPGEEGSEVTAVPDDGYLFVSWDDGVLTPSRKDTAETDKTFTAVFYKDGATYTARYSANAGGKIEGKTTQSIVSGNQTEAVTAVALEGYVFVCWNDGNTEETRSDTVYGDVTFTAQFEKRATVFVCYAASDGGQIEGISEQTVYLGDETEAVTAVANAGYVFDYWTDGKTEATRSDILSEDTVLIAVFKKAE